MKRFLLAAVCFLEMAASTQAIQLIFSGPLQNVTLSPPIILEPLSTFAESAFWAALLAKGAITVLDRGLVPLTNHEVGVWTYNLMEHNKFVWMDKTYPTRDLIVMTSYFFEPRSRQTVYSRRIQFTTINQWTGEEQTTVNWDTTRPVFWDFNYLKVSYKRLAAPMTHDTDFDYDSTGKTMFYCYRSSGLGYPRPLRVTVYGLDWIPKFQQDSMRKTFVGDYSNTRWAIMGIDGLVVWMPSAPPNDWNVEFHGVGEATAFYQFPFP